MRRSVIRSSIITCLILFLGASVSFAGTVNLSNGTQSGTVSWSLVDSDTIRICVENTTLTTYSAGDLLTAVWFDLPGAGSATLVAGWAIPVWVDGSGIATIGTTPQDLLAWTNPTNGKTKPTWSLESISTGLNLKFNPDAQFAIIGPSVTNSSGQETYPDSNGGIRANGGHNPFAYQKAVFDIDITGSFASKPIDVQAIVFGTSFETVVVPLPSAAWAGLGLLGVMGAVRRFRRHRDI